MNEQTNTPTPEKTQKQTWNAPKLSKLDLEMTEWLTGPNNDGDGGFTSNPM
jgi:hypothetical protein